MRIFFKCILFTILFSFSGLDFLSPKNVAIAQEVEVPVAEVSEHESLSIFSRAWQSGFLVFMVLISLILSSIAVWAVIISKAITLQKVQKKITSFVQKFWDSRSLNELNAKLKDYPDSPAKELFKQGYGELLKGRQLRDIGHEQMMVLTTRATLDNLMRTLQKSKIQQRQKLDRGLWLLSISAAICPFVGLLGTVWGIMNAFEGIAQTGDTSLAAVAPGISEALVATAFGLGAAIPAAVGFNLLNKRIRDVLSDLDCFIVDFLNIVERFIVNEKHKALTNLHSDN